MKIKKLFDGVNVAPILWALQENPHLWNANTARTSDPSSPHYGLSDIWARYAEKITDQPHDAVWYKDADCLPIKGIVYQLMSMVGGDRLGGVLITKIQPGAMCKPHEDSGWHARYYQKFAVQIQSHPKQAFHFEGESLVTKPGDVFWFDNQYTHWVTNDSDTDRITMIVCIKTDMEV